MADAVGTSPARSPWALAWRRLKHNRVAMISLALFCVIVAACLAAPLYAHDVAHTDPFTSNVNGTTIVNGKTVPVLQQGGGKLGIGETPIGPPGTSVTTSSAPTDRAATSPRALLYGGRNSLLIGVASALICCALALLIGLVAGFFGGFVDSVLARLLDVVWAFPVYLLAISVSVIALTSGLHLGVVTLSAGSLWIPIGIIAIVYVPYVARPIRGQVLSLREKDFVDAAIALGASNWFLIFSEILPNVVTTVIVFFPLMIATNMLTESALSFLSIGVQPPDASWGTIISDGQELALHPAHGRDRARDRDRPHRPDA